MIFETQLKKLKYEVLQQVAVLAKENRLNREELEKVHHQIVKGDKPQYRCCIYKERAIVNERVKLAAGYMPGEQGDELINIKDEDQMIYVIEAACDRCPINKYTVTEACRGCIAHRCVEGCPANAITKVAGRAYINQEQCRECGLCKKACPYNAISEVMRPCKRVCPTGALQINEADRRAAIKKEDCIQCGSCMAACPFGAISDKSYIVPVTRALMEKKKMYAVVAPAIAGQFGSKVSVGQIKNAFLKLGFVNMIEAGCGADAVTVHEGLEFIERMEEGQKYMTNSCCPGFLGFVEKKYPDQLARVSGTVSPMVATARWIKKSEPEAMVVFIGPCTAKKSEARRDNIKDAVDYVLTFEEIGALLGAFEIEPENLEEIKVEDASLFGRGFAQGGGLTAAIENFIQVKKNQGDFKLLKHSGPDVIKKGIMKSKSGRVVINFADNMIFLKQKDLDVDFKPVRTSGFEEVNRAMLMAKSGKLEGNFIEGMMCEGGCIGGPATMVPIMRSKPQLRNFSNQSNKKEVLSNDKLTDFEGVNLER